VINIRHKHEGYYDFYGCESLHPIRQKHKLIEAIKGHNDWKNNNKVKV
jgi:hypothetical protein